MCGQWPRQIPAPGLFPITSKNNWVVFARVGEWLFSKCSSTLHFASYETGGWIIEDKIKNQNSNQEKNGMES